MILRRATTREELIYEISIIDFFNARHAIGDEPAHSHSWKVEMQVSRPRYLGEQVLISIEETRRIMRSLFARYEDNFLNDIPPFTFQEPSAENLVVYLFEQLEKEFYGTDATLRSVTIWESPTNSVTVKVRD